MWIVSSSGVITTKAATNSYVHVGVGTDMVFISLERTPRSGMAGGCPVRASLYEMARLERVVLRSREGRLHGRSRLL